MGNSPAGFEPALAALETAARPIELRGVMLFVCPSLPKSASAVESTESPACADTDMILLRIPTSSRLTLRLPSRLISLRRCLRSPLLWSGSWSRLCSSSRRCNSSIVVSRRHHYSFRCPAWRRCNPSRHRLCIGWTQSVSGLSVPWLLLERIS